MGGKRPIKYKIILGTPDWMLSFGDMLSCLLVFFVLMVVFSSDKPGKAADLMGSYVEPGDVELESPKDGQLRGKNQVKKPLRPPSPSAEKLTNANIIKNITDLKDKLKKQGFTFMIIPNETEEGVAIDIPLSLLLQDSPEAKLVYKEIITLQKSLNIDIEATFFVKGIPVDDEDRPDFSAAQKSIAAVHRILLAGKVAPSSCRTYLRGSTRPGDSRVRILFLNGLGRKRITMEEFLRIQ
ncbi:MAG: Membrane MotB of proton-channel complex MotA/MotB [Verrucomicrobiota bacterium]|jgi:flagellar motor protein MotB